MWPDCMVSSKECIYGCKTYNTCDRCIECKTNPDCDVAGKSCGSLGCKEYNSCSKCITCNTDPCSGVSCGSNAYCSGGSCYCNSGYHKSGSACVKDEVHTHSYSCPSGYSSSNSWGSSAQTTSKTCSCGAASGTCYKAPAHTHSYSCPSGYSETKTARSCKTTSKRCSCGATSGTCYREFICTDVGTAHRDYPTSICTLSVTVITGCGYTIQCYSCRSCNSC